MNSSVTDPTVMNPPTMRPPAIGKIWQWLLRPVGWPLHLLAIAAAALALWGAIPPGGYIGTWLVSALLWLAVGLLWMGRAIARCIVAKVRQQPLHELPGGWKSWWVAPLLLL